MVTVSSATTPYPNTVYHYSSSGVLLGSTALDTTIVTGYGNQITKLANGGFVSVWTNTAGTDNDIYMQVFDASANKVGEITKVNTITAGAQINASVAELVGGGYVVAWVDTSNNLGNIRIQQYDDVGVKVGLEKLVASTPTTAIIGNRGAVVEGLANGGYVVGWTNIELQKLYLQAYDASGNTVGGLYSEATGASLQPDFSIAGLPSGGFVVNYRGPSVLNGSVPAIRMMIFGEAGAVRAVGTAAADNLAGSDYADTITGAGGADIIYTGAGDDTVILNTDNVTQLANAAATTMVVDGGTGVNMLKIANTTAGTGTTLDLTNATVLGKVHHFSSIDITGPTSTATNNTLKLDWKAAMAMAAAPQNPVTGAGEILVVNGNAGDNVNLTSLSSWAVGSSQDGVSLSSTFGSGFNFVSGKTYTGYTLNGVTVFVNDAVTTSDLTGGAAPVTNAKTVLELFGPSFSDVDSVANGGTQVFKGVAITSAGSSTEVSASGRHYEFSNDGGTTWTALAAGLTDSTAVFLSPTALIRFVDSAGAALSFANVDLKARLVDSSGLTSTANLVSGNSVDASLNGGSTAFSGSPVVVGLFNTAPVANPTSVTNAFVASTGPEVTITDSASAATVANSTDVTFTLTFSEAVKASTLTEADLSVTNGTLKAGTLTKVSDTVWTVQATSAATGSNSMALTVADGSYTNTTGVVGSGNTGTQGVGSITVIAGPAINGASTEATAPAGWSIATGTPDIYAQGTTSFTYAGFPSASVTGVNGNSLNQGGYAIMLSGALSYESISTSLTGLTVGNTYRYGVQWQQFSLISPTYDFTGGELRLIVNGVTQVFKTTQAAAVDGWMTAIVEFVATSTTAPVVISGNGISSTTGANGGAIAVDSLSAAQIQSEIDAGTPVFTSTFTGTTGADILVGKDFDETFIAAGGADKILAGAGDDKVTINESNVTALSGATAMVIDGGTGVNTLTLTNTSAAATIDMTNATVDDRLKNFSSIDITGTQNNTLKLDWRAISTLSGATDNTATNADESKMLVVSGNAGDTVNLVSLSSWSAGSSQTAASLTSTYGSAYNFLSGHTYKAYTLNGATVFVDDAVTLSNLASSTTAYTPVTNAMTVQALFGPSFTDANLDQSFKGVAITSAGTVTNVNNGLKYQYSTDGGSTWNNLAGGLTDSTAVYLAPNALIRFADTSGAATAVASVPLTARLVDTSGLTGTASLSSGTTVDASTNGGTTAFSGSPVTVSLLNRAPMSSDADGIVVADPFGAANE